MISAAAMLLAACNGNVPPPDSPVWQNLTNTGVQLTQPPQPAYGALCEVYDANTPGVQPYALCR